MFICCSEFQINDCISSMHQSYIALSQVKYIIDEDIFKKKVLFCYAMMYEPYVMFGIIFCPWQKREFG